MSNIFEITDEGLQSLYSMMELPKEDLNLEALFKQRDSYKVEDGIAYVHIFGPLIRNASDFQKLQSLTDYGDLTNEITQAIEDPEVSLIALRIDSPGGESIGCIEVAKLIETSPKPILAMVEGIAASAAYKLASASTAIIASESSEIGSIGSIIIVTDTKQAMNNMGVVKHIIANSQAVYKSTGQDFGSLTDLQKQHLQKKVEESAKRFQEYVLSNRPEINQMVFEGAMYYSKDALELGLIDEIF